MSLAKFVLAEPFKPHKNILIDKNPFVIGRSDDCSLVIDRQGISKKHAAVTFDGEEYKIEDLQSKNGTRVNGQKIQSHTLRENDLITISGIDLTFSRIRSEQVQSDLEKNVSKLKSAMNLSRAMNANLILDPILDEIMDGLMRLSQAERGFLLLSEDGGKLEMVRSVNITSEQLHNESSKLSLSAVEKAMESRQSVVLSNALDDTYFGGQTSVQELEIRTLVCIPIQADSKHPIGILYADSASNKQIFTELDIEVLESLASNAAIAIQNAQLHRDIWKLIDQTSDVLREVEQKVSTGESLHQSVRNTLDSLSNLNRKRPGKRTESKNKPQNFG